jgi:hypothetical protein
VENDLVRRLLWAGTVAVSGALASLLANRIATAVWLRVFKEEPPE